MRKKGLVPSPGRTGGHDWEGFVPNGSLPFSINPEPKQA
ncbi:MAG: penicillin acylase family protein [Deltaproteobacteria bacterium]|nr:penicillin acylase family protein [Deltaproteobacteria bacterium]